MRKFWSYVHIWIFFKFWIIHQIITLRENTLSRMLNYKRLFVMLKIASTFSVAIKICPLFVVCKLFLYFHLFLRNGGGGVIHGGKDLKLFMRSMWPTEGPQRGALKWKKGLNFKNLLLQTPNQCNQDMLYVDTFIYEEYSLFMARHRMAPFGP